MNEMELREGAGVYTPDNEQVGTVSGFVLDPKTNVVTHLVVQKGLLFTEDRVLPLEGVRSATEDRVILRENIDDIDQLTPFEESHYVRSLEADASRGGEPRAGRDRDMGMRTFDEVNRDPVTEADVSRGGEPLYSPMPGPGYYWYPPYGYTGPSIGIFGWPRTEKTQNIPAGTVHIKEGTDVFSSDGEHVGDVERLLVEPDTNRATHFTISQGLLFKDRKLIPAHWVESTGEDKIRLSVSSEFLRELPSYED